VIVQSEEDGVIAEHRGCSCALGCSSTFAADSVLLQGEAMGDLRDICARLHGQGLQWLKREAELMGMVLWAVGITTLAWLPDTGVLTPVHPSVFVGLKVVAAWLWLLVGTQCLRRCAKRTTHKP
jgi:hypothetical protein